jgi:hypothetical protein
MASAASGTMRDEGSFVVLVVSPTVGEWLR